MHGTARLELEPTTQAGTVTLRLRFNERQAQEVRAWLEPSARDWIMVGIASGTAAWNRISGQRRGRSTRQAHPSRGFDGAGRLAFFARAASAAMPC